MRSPGPVLLKRKSWMFICLASTKRKQIKTNDEMDQCLVCGALDDTKTIGKAGADIFANFGAEKP